MHSYFAKQKLNKTNELRLSTLFLTSGTRARFARNKNTIVMVPTNKQRKKKIKTLAAFDDDDDEEEEEEYDDGDKRKSDDEPLPKLVIGDKRVRTGTYMPSFVPKEKKRNDEAKVENDAINDEANGVDDDVAKRKRTFLGDGEACCVSRDEEKKLGEKRARANDHQNQKHALSSNVIVKNLPSREDFESLFPKELVWTRQLFERKILESFSAFGPIASLSIKKSGGGSSSSNNNGSSSMAFLAYLTKSSAENAIEKINSGQFLFYGVQLEANLGGAVVVLEKVWPPAPLAVMEKRRAFANDNYDHEREGEENDGVDDESRRVLYLDENIHTRGEVQEHFTAAVPSNVSADNPEEEQEKEGIVNVRFPKDYAQMKRIDVTATFVAEDGKAIEHRIKAKKKEDPDFAFLFDTIEENEETVYYLWRVFSLANGDSLTSFRTEPFRMFAPNGKIWMPPVEEIKMAPKDNSNSNGKDLMSSYAQWPTSNGAGVGASSSLVDYNVDRGEAQKALSETDQKRLKELLTLLTLERDRVRELTTFAIDHAICAEEIIAKLKEEMEAQKESHKLEAQVSLLYAFSDVLHNASAPVKHASSYRMVIKRALPEVFKALGESLKHCGVIAKPPFMRRVLRVCKAWREWYAFDVSFCDELEETFLSDK